MPPRIRAPQARLGGTMWSSEEELVAGDDTGGLYSFIWLSKNCEPGDIGSGSATSSSEEGIGVTLSRPITGATLSSSEAAPGVTVSLSDERTIDSELSEEPPKM